MKKPLVSIIMGVYNDDTTLVRCLESIMNQTYTEWEFIICNDGSTDKTADILEDYHNKDSRIKVLHNTENMRLAATLNRCLEIANGEYVARMDADDECIPERIEKQVEYLEGHKNVDCVGCNMMIFDESGDIGIRESIENPVKEDMLIKTPFFHPTIMMKKEVFDSLKGYRVSEKTMRAEDLDLWFRFFKANYRGHNIQETLYRYHESRDDYKKRTVKAAFKTSLVYLDGYKSLDIPRTKYIYAFKPVISALLPNVIMEKYHRIKLR